MVAQHVLRPNVAPFERHSVLLPADEPAVCRARGEHALPGTRFRACLTVGLPHSNFGLLSLEHAKGHHAGRGLRAAQNAALRPWFLLLFIPDPLLCGGRSLALLVQGHLNENLKPAGMVGIMGRCATVPRHHIAHESPPPICRAGLRAMQQLKPLI